MKAQAQIDETLRLLGSVAPPCDLERRIHTRLAAGRRRGFTAVHYVSIVALAACVGAATVVLSPALRDSAARDLALDGHWGISAPRILPHPAGSFGAASAVRVPTAPVPVAPVPVTQGRGHTRSERAMSPQGVRAALPRGVAVPPRVHIVPHAVSSPRMPVSSQP